MKTWYILFGIWLFACVVTYIWLKPQEMSFEAPFKPTRIEESKSEEVPSEEPLITPSEEDDLPAPKGLPEPVEKVEEIEEIEIDTEKSHHEVEPYEYEEPTEAILEDSE